MGKFNLNCNQIAARPAFWNNKSLFSKTPATLSRFNGILNANKSVTEIIIMIIISVVVLPYV